ncbi:MAG: chromosome segregation SMC family protein [Methylophilaceae bacterium]
MKLRQIKLAGFKSFVDPTTIQLDEKLGSIVGPNGCGKSNIVEAVKWVMGSSSAKELRSDSMDDVIFYGTDTRQAVSRANVELIFDNSENRAPEEWSKYSEISVKRVIEKDKGSNYLINNTVVRRKDVADLFLGTGLGSRGYAIIGQNKVTQLVEAKPEELRGFLEEAAGVSKYKERRKETEFRLRDTKENLSRVQDLVQEIKQQSAKLKSQAEAANRYHKQQENLKFHQAQVWALKKRVVNQSWETIKKKIEEQTLELDQFTASLREIESKVETARQDYTKTADEINLFQSKFYDINAQVSNTENSLANIKNNIERLTQTQKDSKEKILSLQVLETNLNKEIEQNKNIIKTESEKMETHEQTNQDEKSKYTDLEEKYNAATTKIQKARSDRESNFQKLREESLAKITKTREDIDANLKKLREESLAKIESSRNKRDINFKKLSETEVRINSLNDFIESDIKLDDIQSWLKKAGVTNQQPILDQITIKDGWDNAFGIFLESHVHAYESEQLSNTFIENRPSKTITLINKNKLEDKFKRNDQLISAMTVIKCNESHISGAVNEWLSNVYLSNEKEILTDRNKMNYGDILILKNGDIYGKTYQVVRSKNGENINLLARKKQLDELTKNEASIKKEYQTSIDQLNKIEEEAKLNEENLQTSSAEKLSAVQNEAQTLEQTYSSQSNIDLNLIEEEVNLSQQLFNEQKNKMFESDKLKQEIQFNIKLNSNKNNDLTEKIQSLINEKSDLEKIIEESIIQLKDNSVENFEADLKLKIKEKEKAEEDLTLIRETLTSKEDHLKTIETARLEKQQSLSPLQSSLQELKIEEREIKVNFEQCCSELEKASINEDDLLAKLNEDDKIEDIEEKCQKITAKIERMGPVNLAAIEELTAIEKREVYLQKQMDDLIEASNTLEQAIRKIDIETREKLSNTYDAVNENFNFYFKKLFSGGRAKLELLGEEILDSGFHIIAQPPGKKNVTIPQLSGGEKTLTAIALVFALFKLNPAPFCFMDEVDAPLDETNVGNFCSLVQNMSEATQIILVTHQKQTMEMSDQLIGVTSAEKGVSRIVEVNLQDVEKMEVTN